MAKTAERRVNWPAWVDLSSPDPAASRDFYAKLFGWQFEVSPDPQYGGYAIANVDGLNVAGIGSQIAPGPVVWSLYIGSADADESGRHVQAAGGTVVMPAFDVGDQGRIGVFRDPSGAFISVWESRGMGTFRTGDPGCFGWAELNVRGLEEDLPFYAAVFGWTSKQSPMAEGQPPYTELQADGESIAGAMELDAARRPEQPSYWMIYFMATDVDDAFRRAIDAGASEMVAPTDFPGGRFAIVSDPQGAMFGLLKTA